MSDTIDKFGKLIEHVNILESRVSGTSSASSSPHELVVLVRKILSGVSTEGLLKFDPSVYTDEINNDLRSMLKTIYLTSDPNHPAFKTPTFMILSKYSGELLKYFSPKNVVPINDFSKDEIEKFLYAKDLSGYSVMLIRYTCLLW